jgi:riboflavin biosynthesis pyrimidine reductase
LAREQVQIPLRTLNLRGEVAEAALTDDGVIDPSIVIEALRERGHRLTLFEAGPRTFGAFAAAGLIDELFLTVSPLLTGGSAVSRRSLVEGVEPLRDGLVGGALLTLRQHHDHLFVRYRLAPDRSAIDASVAADAPAFV